MITPEKLRELEALLTGSWLTDLANFSAFFFEEFTDLNWIGFYLSDGRKLKLGPFQGKPACTEIAFHRGVCGLSFSKKQPVLVPDVHAFPDHIICDPSSRSELVVPLIVDGVLVGVLDMDSPKKERFQQEHISFFEKALQIVAAKNSTLKNVIHWI